MAKVKRRLTSILCADVKSYARLMERDEPRTPDMLRASKEAMAGLIDRHDGRVVNTWGDALIAEFPGVIDAVQCAVEIQRELAERNRGLSGGEQMWFRVGINLGDVMVEDGDIYGEGVNIAARLQEMAEPGGIMISASVYEQVRNKIPIAFRYLGAQTVKNMSHPVSSYRVFLETGAAPQAAEEPVGTGSGGSTTPFGRTGALAAGWSDLPRSIKVASCFIVFFFDSTCSAACTTSGSSGRRSDSRSSSPCI
jgi:adenylate cyclase